MLRSQYGQGSAPAMSQARNASVPAADLRALYLARERCAAAVAEGDILGLRDLLERGATFASFTIRMQTELAEAQFAAWLRAGRPADVRESGRRNLWQDVNARLAAVRALTDAQVWTLATIGSPAAEELFAEWTIGYRQAKASFALACAGFGRMGCLDSRLLRKHGATLDAYAAEHGAPTWAKLMSRKGAWAHYAAACRLLWGKDSAAGQWAEWLADLAAERYTTGHEVLA